MRTWNHKFSPHQLDFGGSHIDADFFAGGVRLCNQSTNFIFCVEQ
jgi:hypothetical protein